MKRVMIVYKTTNLINGKIYIGQSSTKNPTYLGSGFLLKRAIKKYGKENFKKETLEECSTKEELNLREIFWIDKFGSNINGYNMTTGGTGGDTLKNHPNLDGIKIKMKRIYSPEEREKRSERMKGSKNPSYGKKLKKDIICEVCGKTTDKLNYGRRHGKLCGTIEKDKCLYCEKESSKIDILTHHNEFCIFNPNRTPIKGYSHTEETKLKMSEIKKGKPTWNKGKKLSEEHKNNLSISKKSKSTRNSNNFNN